MHVAKRSYSRDHSGYECLPSWARAVIEEMAQDINVLGVEIASLKEDNLRLILEVERLRHDARTTNSTDLY